MPTRLIAIVEALGLTLALVACSHDPTPRGPLAEAPRSPAAEAPRPPAEPLRFPVVPPRAPDYEPEDMYADSAIIADTEWISGPFLRNVIGVAFMPGATQAERQAAIDLIGGVVIGGMAYADDGEYYVRIAGDYTGEAVVKATELLGSLPQVYAAWAIIVPTGDETYDVPPADTSGSGKGGVRPDSTRGGSRPPARER